MSDSRIEINGIGKKFGRRRIFENVNFVFGKGEPSGIAGHNGAGKSTLVKIIANVISPNEGETVYYHQNAKLEKEKIFERIGFVAPYLVLYSEFSPLENLRFFSEIRGIEFNLARAEELLKTFNIYKRRNDYLRGFSSGMLQRMKFVFALYHNPDFLLLDEPTSNLDEEGKRTVYELTKKLAQEKVVIIASNESNDLALCGKILELEKFKKKK
jgi:heme exporter protein A